MRPFSHPDHYRHRHLGSPQICRYRCLSRQPSSDSGSLQRHRFRRRTLIRTQFLSLWQIWNRFASFFACDLFSNLASRTIDFELSKFWHFGRMMLRQVLGSEDAMKHHDKEHRLDRIVGSNSRRHLDLKLSLLEAKSWPYLQWADHKYALFHSRSQCTHIASQLFRLVKISTWSMLIELHDLWMWIETYRQDALSVCFNTDSFGHGSQNRAHASTACCFWSLCSQTFFGYPILLEADPCHLMPDRCHHLCSQHWSHLLDGRWKHQLACSFCLELFCPTLWRSNHQSQWTANLSFLYLPSKLSWFRHREYYALL